MGDTKIAIVLSCSLLASSAIINACTHVQTVTLTDEHTVIVTATKTVIASSTVINDSVPVSFNILDIAFTDSGPVDPAIIILNSENDLSYDAAGWLTPDARTKLGTVDFSSNIVIILFSGDGLADRFPTIIGIYQDKGTIPVRSAFLPPPLPSSRTGPFSFIDFVIQRSSLEQTGELTFLFLVGKESLLASTTAIVTPGPSTSLLYPEPKVTKSEAYFISAGLVPQSVLGADRIVTVLSISQPESHGVWATVFSVLTGYLTTKQELLDFGWKEDCNTTFGDTDTYRQVQILVDAQTGEVIHRTAYNGIDLGGPPPNNS